MARSVFAGVLGQMAQNLGWADEANCRHMDVNLFFPRDGQNVSAFAREVCAECPVIGECLWYANEMHTDDGFFGGMTPKERKAWRVRNGVKFGMSYDAWRKTQRSNLLYVAPDEWRDDEQAV